MSVAQADMLAAVTLPEGFSRGTKHTQIDLRRPSLLEPWLRTLAYCYYYYYTALELFNSPLNCAHTNIDI